MTAVQVSRIVDAPVERTWATVVDVGRYPGTVRSYVRVEHLSSHTEGVGARWRQTRTVFGREHAQVLTIAEWDPPRRLVATASEAGARYVTTYLLAGNLGGGTTLDVTFEVVPTNLVGRVVGRLFGGRLLESTRVALDQDVADLAAAAGSSVHPGDTG